MNVRGTYQLHHGCLQDQGDREFQVCQRDQGRRDLREVLLVLVVLRSLDVQVVLADPWDPAVQGCLGGLEAPRRDEPPLGGLAVPKLCEFQKLVSAVKRQLPFFQVVQGLLEVPGCPEVLVDPGTGLGQADQDLQEDRGDLLVQVVLVDHPEAQK